MSTEGEQLGQNDNYSGDLFTHLIFWCEIQKKKKKKKKKKIKKFIFLWLLIKKNLKDWKIIIEFFFCLIFCKMYTQPYKSYYSNPKLYSWII